MINFNLASYASNQVDKIIATFSGTITIPAGGSNQVTHSLPIAAGHTFWAGTYTLSGSTQQNDIGSMQYSGVTGVGLEARSFVGGILIRGQNGTGSSQTATYNIAVIASPETGVIPTIGTFAPRVVTYMFDSRENHHKIAEEVAANTSTRAAANSYGFSPRVRMFFVWTDGYMYESAVAYTKQVNFVTGTAAGPQASNAFPAQNSVHSVANSFPSITALYVRFYYD